jgi:menaquinone-dependent protoporphyrinogen oxidase
MARIAVIYDSTEGQTAKISRRIAETATEQGYDPDVIDVRNPPPGFGLEGYSAVILGASVHVGKHSRQVTAFVRANRSQLERMPSAFFSVSLSAAGRTDRQQRNARDLLDAFLRETAWRPQATATFAGALLYREYGFFKRLLLKWIAKREGGDTDTSKNYEYTDWNRVAEFTREFFGQIP